jgi:hypothetical protein
METPQDTPQDEGSSPGRRTSRAEAERLLATASPGPFRRERDAIEAGKTGAPYVETPATPSPHQGGCGEPHDGPCGGDTPPGITTSPAPLLLDGRSKDAVHWAETNKAPEAGTTCRYAPPVEKDDVHGYLTWAPTITNWTDKVTCAQCSNRLAGMAAFPDHVDNHRDVDPDLIRGLKELTDRYGPLGVRRTLDDIHGPFPAEHDTGPSGSAPPTPSPPSSTSGPMPIDHVVIRDGLDQSHIIEGSQFAQGGLKHDVDQGAVTVTFVNVRSLEVIYKHMLNDQQGDPQ